MPVEQSAAAASHRPPAANREELRVEGRQPVCGCVHDDTHDTTSTTAPPTSTYRRRPAPPPSTSTSTHALLSQPARQGARSTSDIQHEARTELVDDGDVGIEVATIRVQRVIDTCQAQIFEAPVP